MFNYNYNNFKFNDLVLTCCICNTKKQYDCETEFFQDGFFFGLRGVNRDEIHCLKCIAESEVNNA